MRNPPRACSPSAASRGVFNSTVPSCVLEVNPDTSDFTLLTRQYRVIPRGASPARRKPPLAAPHLVEFPHIRGQSADLAPKRRSAQAQCDFLARRDVNQRYRGLVVSGCGLYIRHGLGSFHRLCAERILSRVLRFSDNARYTRLA